MFNFYFHYSFMVSYWVYLSKLKLYFFNLLINFVIFPCLLSKFYFAPLWPLWFLRISYKYKYWSSFSGDWGGSYDIFRNQSINPSTCTIKEASQNFLVRRSNRRGDLANHQGSIQPQNILHVFTGGSGGILFPEYVC